MPCICIYPYPTGVCFLFITIAVVYLLTSIYWFCFRKPLSWCSCWYATLNRTSRTNNLCEGLNSMARRCSRISPSVTTFLLRSTSAREYLLHIVIQAIKVFGRGSQILTNQRLENNAFKLRLVTICYSSKKNPFFYLTLISFIVSEYLTLRTVTLSLCRSRRH